VTLAEVLLKNGYQAFGIIANTFIPSIYGFNQGFETLVEPPFRHH